MSIHRQFLCAASLVHPARKDSMLDDVGAPAMTYNTVVMGTRKVFRTFVLIGLGIVLTLGCQPENGGDTLEANRDGTEQSALVITVFGIFQ